MIYLVSNTSKLRAGNLTVIEPGCICGIAADIKPFPPKSNLSELNFSFRLVIVKLTFILYSLKFIWEKLAIHNSWCCLESFLRNEITLF
jgi:hypothetical protein